MTLNSKTALVTGAGSGIGRAVARLLLAQGADVVMVGRRASALAETANGDAHAHLVMSDLAREGEAARLQSEVVATFGKLDILVHSAGIYARDSETEALDEMRAVNARAPEALSRALLPLLVAAQGEIVFVNSTIVHNSQPTGLTTYVAGKLELQRVANTLRQEVNPLGVRVLSVYVGRTATPMQAQIFADEGRVYKPELLLQPDDVARSILNAILMPRTAEMTDLTIRPMQTS